MFNIDKDLKTILDISISLTCEKDYNKLLEKILKESMRITNSDAGTLYLYKDNSLIFKIMRTNSLDIYKGGNGEEINLPPVPFTEKNVCSYCAIHKKLINIEDVYNNEQFDFSGPKNYDFITKYKTKSMLVIPLIDHENELIGVIQLINKLDIDNNIICYNKRDEYITIALSSQAAVSLSNMQHMHSMKELFFSFASVMASAIDERSPYNANHTRNVSYYIEQFVDFINSENKQGVISECFSENEKDQIILASKLHDIGKIVIPLSVMDKADRLGHKLSKIHNRFEIISSYLKIDLLENKINKSVYDEKIEYLHTSLKLIEKLNKSGFLSLEEEILINELSKKYYEKSDSSQIYYITKEESECLLIKKGTLTENERSIMESHAAITSKLLSNFKFNKQYENVSKWAGSHHELLDGSGYPDGLTAKDIPNQVRMITIVDIYDALTCKDRPYKKPMPEDKAFAILYSMADEGKLDKYYVNLFEKCIKANSKGVSH